MTTQSTTQSIVEQTLRIQRQSLGEIAERNSRLPNGPFPTQDFPRILMFGLGSSHYVARLVAHTLLRANGLGKTLLVPATALQIGTEIQPQKGDLAIGFSHRGRNKPTLAALDLCKKAGAYTVFVSAQGAAEPGRADLIVEAGSLERCEPHSIAITGAVCAATTLLLGKRAADAWAKVAVSPDPDLARCREEVGEGPTILLGEWAAEWVAKEGALKFIEVPRQSVRAFGSEEYFHGTSWGWKPSDRVWHISSPEDLRAKDIAAEAQKVIEIPSNDPVLAPVAWVEPLIQLQWLALALALNRGENPDDPIGAVERLKTAGV